MGTEIYFGLYNSLTTFPGSFNGQLDDIGIWNRVLDINEIGSLYGGSCQVYDTITIFSKISHKFFLISNYF